MCNGSVTDPQYLPFYCNLTDQTLSLSCLPTITNINLKFHYTFVLLKVLEEKLNVVEEEEEKIPSSQRLALLIDRSCDSEISVKGLDKTYLIEGLRDWRQGESREEEKERNNLIDNNEDDDDDDSKLNEDKDEADVFYEDCF
ncbi:hypothetical protein L873DRAFT_1787597 [Choiromyces venosus 120613-1]|uniref:Uncharacterized protein n=1 Tax=Choiromyces venosus 120613-1 TaxID=1336337 RepID=A0A3N4JW73_9PEZI|nr:hypothetical protein L873DRAFT_1787597 [Choiromyces venosus 120613-1]